MAGMSGWTGHTPTPGCWRGSGPNHAIAGKWDKKEHIFPTRSERKLYISPNKRRSRDIPKRKRNSQPPGAEMEKIGGKSIDSEIAGEEFKQNC